MYIRTPCAILHLYKRLFKKLQETVILFSECRRCRSNEFKLAILHRSGCWIYYVSAQAVPNSHPEGEIADHFKISSWHSITTVVWTGRTGWRGLRSKADRAAFISHSHTVIYEPSVVLLLSIALVVAVEGLKTEGVVLVIGFRC